MNDKILGHLELNQCTDPLCEVCEIANEVKQDKNKIALLDLTSILQHGSTIRVSLFQNNYITECWYKLDKYIGEGKTYNESVLNLRREIMPCPECKGQGSTCGAKDFPNSEPNDIGQTWSYCDKCDGRGWK